MNCLSLVLLILLTPSQEVAVSTAVVRASINRFPELKSDFDKTSTGPRGGSPHGDSSAAPSPPRGLRFEIDPQSVAAVDERYSVTYYSASWCGLCPEQTRRVKAGHEKLNITTGTGSTPRINDNGTMRDASLPLFTWIDANGERRSHEGLVTLAKLVEIIERSNVKKLTASELRQRAATWSGPHVGVEGMTPEYHLVNHHGFTADQLVGLSRDELLTIHSATHAGAIMPHEARSINAVASRANDRTRAATISGGKGVIQSALAKWRDNIGVGNKVTGTWSKSGSQNFDILQLVRGVPWSARDIYGERGSFSFSAPTTNLIVKESSLDYRLVGDQVRFDVEFWIEASRLGITDVPQSVESAQPVGFSPLMILSGLATLWQLAHPEASVILPGTISVEGVMTDDGTLRVSFPKGKAPSVRVHLLWEWMLGVQAVTVSEEKVRLEFVPQPRSWIKIPGWTFTVME
jgi:hypothetical protein